MNRYPACHILSIVLPAILFLAAPAGADSYKTIDVPAYYWNHGCSPTSGGMLMGYYDLNGYTSLFPGEASTQTQAVYNLIAGPEHIRDYWGYPDPNPGGHENNCIADFMKTSRGDLPNGYTYTTNIPNGLKNYAQYRGYPSNSWSEYWGMFTWSDLVSEIDNDRPMLFSVDSNSDGTLDHSITTMGYKEEGELKYYAARNTWDFGLHWYEFKPISSGQYFGVGKGTFFHFNSPPFTEWIAAGADWAQTSNWDNGIPASTMSARIDNSGTAFITSAATASTLFIGYGAAGSVEQSSGECSLVCELILGCNPGSSGTYSLSGGNLTAFDEFIGRHGTGLFSQDGGTNQMGGSLTLGENDGSVGTYNLSGGMLTAPVETIGDSGTGRFNQSGGINIAGTLNIDTGGTYTLIGGLLSITEGADINGLFDFANGGGTLSVEGGKVDFSDAAISGACNAVFNSSANSFTFFPTGFIPESEFGSMNASGITYTPGTVLLVRPWQVFAGEFEVDDSAEIRGGLTADGGEIVINGDITISDGGSLDINQQSLYLENGRVVTIENTGGYLSTLEIFVGSGSSGVFNQYGGGSVVGTDLYVGDQSGAGGTYNQFAGSNEVSAVLHVGYRASGTYNLSGGELYASDAEIGYYAEGKFNQTGGSHIISGSLRLAVNNLASSGKYYLDGGELITGDLYVGDNLGGGEFSQSGGTLSVSGTMEINSPVQDRSIFNMDGGALEVHTLLLAGSGLFRVSDSSASITIGGKFSLQDNAVIMAVTGTTIRMTGSDFENESTSIGNLMGLESTTFVFEESGEADTFEIASYDFGLIEENFSGNFALEGLVLDGSFNGSLQLVDKNVNYTAFGPRTQNEALYVGRLVLGGQATLDLNGCNLYAMEFVNYGGEVVNGEVRAFSETIIPEPATLLLAGLSLVGLTGIIRRKHK